MKQVTPTVGALSSERCSGPAATLPMLHFPLPAVVGLPAGAPPAALALRSEGEESFRLVVLDAGNAPLLTFGPYPEEDAVAEWRRLAAVSGLVLKIQLPNGAVVTAYPQLGRVLLGETRQRRRHNLLNHRRPRFLTRRKTARFPLRPQVHREAELGSWEG